MINHVKRLGIPSTQTPQINIEPSTKSQKRGTVITSEKDTPQQTCALQERMESTFKNLAKGSPRENSLFKALLHGSPQLKLTKEKKLVNPKLAGRFQEMVTKDLLKIKLI